MKFKNLLCCLLLLCPALIISCSKSKATPEPPQTLYATFVNITVDNTTPRAGNTVNFTPVYINKIDNLTWLIDGVSATTDANATISSSNVLSYTFNDNKAHIFKVVVKANGNQLTNSTTITANGNVTDRIFNVIAFYNGTYDAAHINFVHEANDWFPKTAAANNFTYTATNDWSKLNATTLAQYQVVLFLDDSPHDAAQREAFQKYMENGGSWMGFHVSAFSTDINEWPWYFSKFLGVGTFQTNTWGPTTAVLKVEDQTHPATTGLPATITSAVSEWYSWSNDLRKNADLKILMSVDPSSFPLGSDPNQSWYSGYYPIIWTNTKFKMLYANFGHNAMNYDTNVGLSSTFASEMQDKFIIQGLLWLGGRK